jgi:hypothetical protein
MQKDDQAMANEMAMASGGGEEYTAFVFYEFEIA